MRVFVTGGTGLVGSEVVRLLVARGASVEALVRDELGAARLRALGAAPAFGAVEDPRTWDAVGPTDGIVHAAAIVAARLPWQRFYQVNVEGTRLAAAAARRLGARLVHISSVAVYGRQAYDEPPFSRREDAPFGPLEEHDYYARSKRLAEEAVRAEFTRGLAAVMLRPCVVYGPGDRLFLPRLARLARHGWVPRVGAGTLPLALVHAESVADAALRALDLPAAVGRIYNVTCDGPVAHLQLVRGLAVGVGRPLRSVPVPVGAALALAGAAQLLLRVIGPGLYPGTLTGAVRFWRGGNPYAVERVREELAWNPAVNHEERIAALVREFGTAH